MWSKKTVKPLKHIIRTAEKQIKDAIKSWVDAPETEDTIDNLDAIGK